jgi:uncharacterized protein with GYD domain
MPKYLVQFSYTVQGLAGLLKEGGSTRREATRQLVESLGGKLEAYYFTFGQQDGFIIADMPDNASVAAASLIAASTGAVGTQTTVLLSPEEIDQAVKRSGKYRPPGG